MVAGERGAQSAARVARRRLDPDPIAAGIAQDLAIRDAIERDASRQAEVSYSRFLAQRTREAQDDLLGDCLDRGRQIHVIGRQRLIGLARRPAEELVEAPRGHRQAGAKIEIAHVQAERAVRFHVDQVLEDLVLVPGLAVRGEPHHLVFARVDLEAGVVGESGVQEAERVREMDLLLDFQAVAPADRRRGRRPLAHAVHGEHDGLVKRRREKRARRMAQVVLAEEQLFVPPAAARYLPQLLHEQVFQKQLLPQPQRDRHAEGPVASRREAQIGLEQALELHERLVVEHHSVEIPQRDAALGQAVADGVKREARVVLLARKALFLRGGDDAAVLKQRCGAVVVERRDSEDVHCRSEQRVDERRDCRALREHDEHAQYGHHDENRP